MTFGQNFPLFPKNNNLLILFQNAKNVDDDNDGYEDNYVLVFLFFEYNATIVLVVFVVIIGVSFLVCGSKQCKNKINNKKQSTHQNKRKTKRT